MRRNYENVCKLHMNQYLIIVFPNLAVYSFYLGHQCLGFGYFLFKKTLLCASFILAYTECAFTLPMNMQTFPS